MSHADRNARHEYRSRTKPWPDARLCALVATAAAVPAQAKVLAKVNGVEITEEDMKLAAEDIGPGVRVSWKARRAKTICWTS